MPDYSDNSFRAAAKALTDVVAPALDKSNPLAVEQLRLVVQFLEFFAAQRTLLPRYQRAELAWYVETAAALAAETGESDPHLSGEFRHALEKARALPDGADLEEVAAATSTLASLMSRAVEADGTTKDGSRSRTERLIVERSGRLLDLKRAWFLPYGFESAPDRRPNLEALLKA